MILLAVWSLFGLLALLWTGGALLAVELAQWGGEALASGAPMAAGRELAGLPVPQWLAVWIDPAWLQALQSALSWAGEAAGHLLPLAGSVAGWLVPLVWVLWGVGLAFLLAAAGGLHLLLRRFIARPHRA